MSNISEQLLLRERDVAIICGVSPRTIRDWKAQGRLPQSFKIGGSRFWKKEHIQLWIQENMPCLDKFQNILEEQNKKKIT